jgi:hypothetical protein
LRTSAGGRSLRRAFQLAQHVVDQGAHIVAHGFHGNRSARARQAAQAQIGQQFGGERLLGVDDRAHNLADGEVFAGGIGIKEFEIVGRGNDAGTAHQGERRLGKSLFPILTEHRKSPTGFLPDMRQCAHPPCKKR